MTHLPHQAKAKCVSIQAPPSSAPSATLSSTALPRTQLPRMRSVGIPYRAHHRAFVCPAPLSELLKPLCGDREDSSPTRWKLPALFLTSSKEPNTQAHSTSAADRAERCGTRNGSERPGAGRVRTGTGVHPG